MTTLKEPTRAASMPRVAGVKLQIKPESPAIIALSEDARLMSSLRTAASQQEPEISQRMDTSTRPSAAPSPSPSSNPPWLLPTSLEALRSAAADPHPDVARHGLLRSAAAPIDAVRHGLLPSGAVLLDAARYESLRLAAAQSDLPPPRASSVPDSAASWTRHPLRGASERDPLQSRQGAHSGWSVWVCCCLENADWTCLFLKRIGLTEPLGSAVCQQQFLCQSIAAPTAVSSKLRDTSENWELAVSNPLAACS